MKKKCIAIIPARGGSQRIPKKNIKNFMGVPIIGLTIRNALNSDLFEKVIVSTDSEEISNIAQKFGAEVPFLRPPDLSDNFTPTVPVICHAIEELKKIKIFSEFVCCIYPCTPFLSKQDLIDSFDIFVKSDKSFAYPITEYAHPIQRALKIKKSEEIEFLYPDHELDRTQDLEKFFHDAGQFYWGKSESWLKKIKMHSEGIGFKIPNWRVVDIDNNDDWERAEILYDLIKRKGKLF